MRFACSLLTLALALGCVTASATSVVAADDLPTRLTLVVPLTAPPETTGLIPAEILQSYTGPTGILTTTLNAVIDTPVTIALDPMLIASIRILGDTAPQSAADWLEHLRQAKNEIFPLAYADSDIAALSQAGSGSVLEPTSFAIDPALFPPAEEVPAATTPPTLGPGVPTTAPPMPVQPPTSETLTEWPYTMTDVVWPRTNTVVTADLATFNAVQPVTTLLASGNVAAATSASGTVDGHAVLVSDETVSDLFAQAVSSVPLAEWQANVDALSSTLGGLDRDGALLGTFGRAVPGTFSRLGDTIAAVAALPELTLTPLSETMAEPQAALRLVDLPVDADRLSRFRLLLAAQVRIDPFATLLSDPSVLTGERRLSLLALTSNAWVETPSNWATAVDEWLEQSNTILGSVQIAESSTLNFFQDKGNLPISVSNALDYPVTAYVSVRSTTGILVVLDSHVPVVIEPHSQARASIPVQSIANGEASLVVSLSSESRVPVGATKTVTTNVVAGWETTATFIIAALLLAIFIAGIVRTVLKRRGRNTSEAHEMVTQETGPR